MTDVTDLTLEQRFLLLALSHPAAPGQLQWVDGQWRFTFACVRQQCVPDADIQELIKRGYFAGAVTYALKRRSLTYVFTPAGRAVAQALTQSTPDWWKR